MINKLINDEIIERRERALCDHKDVSKTDMNSSAGYELGYADALGELLEFISEHSGDKRRKNTLGNAFIFITRYTLPRKTSADMAATTALKLWWEEIPPTHKKIILDKIESEKGLWDHDPWLWDEFVEWTKR